MGKKRIGFTFFRPDSLFGWLIVFEPWLHFKPKGIYSHVEVYDPERTIVDRNGVKRYWCFSSYEKEGGVRIKLIGLDKVGATRVELEVDAELADSTWAWAFTQLDLLYGWREIRGFVVPWRHGRPDTWICSEICSEFARQLKLCPADLRCERVTPTDLWNLLSGPTLNKL